VTVAVIDEYTLKAQVAPLILVAALPAVGAGFLFPEMNWKTFAIPPAVLTVLALAAAAFSRDRGKRREKALFREWGGKPTTVMLRYRTGALPQKQLAHLHDFLASKTANTIPTAKREETDPDSADVVYESHATYLRENTRDKKAYPFVFRELTHYGFLRNLWGLRGTAFLLSLAALGASSAWLLLSGPVTWDARWVSPVLDGVAVLMWLLWPDKVALQNAAESYAKALINAGLKMAGGADVPAQSPGGASAP
jgi:hypothetical protein